MPDEIKDSRQPDGEDFAGLMDEMRLVRKLHKDLREENSELRAGQTIKNERAGNMIGILGFVAILFVGNSALSGFLALKVAEQQTTAMQMILDDQKDAFARTRADVTASMLEVEDGFDILTSEIQNEVDKKITILDEEIRTVIDDQKLFIAEAQELQDKILAEALQYEKTVRQVPEIEVVQIGGKLNYDREGKIDGYAFCNTYSSVDVINPSAFTVLYQQYDVYTSDPYYWQEANIKAFTGRFKQFHSVERRAIDRSKDIPANGTATLNFYWGIGVESARKWAAQDEPDEATFIMYKILLESRSGGEQSLEIEGFFELDEDTKGCMRRISLLPK